MIPALMITYNRLEYTKKALRSLIESDCGQIFIFDNGSTGGAKEWINECYYLDLSEDRESLCRRLIFKVSEINIGIAGAMNWFLNEITWDTYCIKVDNDTLIPKDFCARMLPHMEYSDVVQAKHHIIPATNPEGWKGFTKNMKKENGLLYNHFVGGSGVMFRRSLVTSIPGTESKIGGWREFQRQHPELRKAFCEDVEITLLDTDENGTDYSKYEDYYRQTGRL